MRRAFTLLVCATAWLTVVAVSANQSTSIQQKASRAAAAGTGSATQFRALLDTYCVTCHNARLKTGGLILDSASLNDLTADAVLWEKVIHKLRLGAMPPQGRPQPDATSVTQFIDALEHGLDAAYVTHPNPGRAPIHRLNRADYANAIRELLDLKIDVTELLPADSASYGFDNVSDTLKVSPLLLSRYLNAAEKVSAVAVGDKDIGEQALIFNVPKEESQDQYQIRCP